MANHGIVIKSQVAAKNVDAWNRSCIAGSTVDLDNGSIFRLDSQSSGSGESQLWTVTAGSSSGSTLTGVWMAAEDSVNKFVVNGKTFMGMTDDLRDFYNPGGYAFTAFKPQVGDVITLSADAFYNAKSTNNYANASDGTYLLVWGATQTSGVFSCKLLATTYVSIADGTIGTQRVTAYKMVVLAN
jgi:hypothetical protein